MKNALMVTLLALAVAAPACDRTTAEPPDGAARDTRAADRMDVAAPDGSSSDGRDDGRDGGGDGDGGSIDSPAADAPDASGDGRANDGFSVDVAETHGDAATDGGDAATDGGDAGATCGPDVLRAMLCTTYCQGIGTVCTGGNAQFASAEECAAICNAGIWACGNQGDTMGNSLFCRLTHLVLAGVGSAVVECRNAGPASLVCR